MDSRARFIKLFTVVLICGGLFSSPVFADDRQSYIVEFSDSYLGRTENAKSALRDNLQSRAQRQGTQHKINFTHTYNHVMSGAVLELTKDEAKHLERLGFVKHIEKDGVIYPDESWGLDRINQRDLPLNNDSTATHDGTGSTIFIVDTGINETHEEFQGPSGSRVVGNSGVGSITGGDDCRGHGTHVASTAAGTTVGVASGADIYSLRISDDCEAPGSADTADVIAAFDYIRSRVTQDSPASPIIDNAVVNYSYQSTSEALKRSMDSLVRSGVVVVTTSGNNNEDTCNSSTSIKPPSALIVGATTIHDDRRENSNHGPCVSLMAPGEDIWGAEIGGDNEYDHNSGTSMASPHVAGTAAAYLERFPGANNMEVKEAIIQGATEGRLSGLNGSPNLLAYVELDRPDAHWQQAGMMTLPGYYGSNYYPRAGCEEGDNTFTAINRGRDQSVVLRWICM